MLLRHIERFLRSTDMPCTRFSRLATGDPRFVADLRNGRIPRDDTVARVQSFMSEYLAKTTEARNAH